MVKEQLDSKRKEGNVLFNDALNVIILNGYMVSDILKEQLDSKRKEGNFYLNALNVIINFLQLYGVGHIVKEQLDSKEEGRKEGNILFNNAFNTFYLQRLYGIKLNFFKDPCFWGFFFKT